MDVQIVDNNVQTLASLLSLSIEQSVDTRVAVAFVSRDGLDMIQRPLERSLAGNGYAEFLVGLDMLVTEPEALEALFALCREQPNVSLFCHVSLIPGAAYHPKMYLLREPSHVTLVIGSSNLTRGGLERNIEVNMMLQAEQGSRVISDAYDAYNWLKFHQRRIEPDDELVALYAELWKEQRRERKSTSGRTSQTLITFREKVQSLRPPVLTQRDLVGWLGLVYDALPVGEFTNRDAYAHEEEFSQKYPENQNIRAKIRQQLQVLRDAGLIEHIGHGQWRKA